MQNKQKNSAILNREKYKNMLETNHTNTQFVVVNIQDNNPIGQFNTIIEAHNYIVQLKLKQELVEFAIVRTIMSVIELHSNNIDKWRQNDGLYDIYNKFNTN